MLINLLDGTKSLCHGKLDNGILTLLSPRDLVNDQVSDLFFCASQKFLRRTIIQPPVVSSVVVVVVVVVGVRVQIKNGITF